MIQRHKQRNIWEDRIAPPRRYFDKKPLEKVLLDEFGSSRVDKECQRTNLANSTWFNGIVERGQFYKPLTVNKGLIASNDNKELSVELSVAKSQDLETAAGDGKPPFVNVAHMLYDYKRVNGDGDLSKKKMNLSLAKAMFNRETDFAKVLPLEQRMSPPRRPPSQ